MHAIDGKLREALAHLAAAAAVVVARAAGMRGGHHAMGHPGAGHDVAVGVGRDRLDRRGADINSDRQLGHGGRD